jgi:hypothetical protein
MILSSIACVEPSAKLMWKEVDVRGFYCRLEPLDFRLRVCPSHEMSWYQVEVGAVNSTPIFFFFADCRSGLGEDVQEQFIPWHPWQVSFPRLTTPDATENEPIRPPPQELNAEYASIEAAAHGLLRVLDAAVQKRVQHIQTVDPAPGEQPHAAGLFLMQPRYSDFHLSTAES